MLFAAARVRTFTPTMWPHHRALREFTHAGDAPGAIAPAARHWTFRPFADGGYALVGLERLFLELTGRGSLRRHESPIALYEVAPAFRAWGDDLCAQLSSADRVRLERVAQRLKAAMSDARICLRQWAHARHCTAELWNGRQADRAEEAGPQHWSPRDSPWTSRPDARRPVVPNAPSSCPGYSISDRTKSEI